MFWESDIQRTHDSSGMGFVDCKAKRVVATAGTVSGVIGKDYVRSSPLDKERGRGGGGGGGEQHYNSPKWKNTCMVNGVSVGNEEAEQFLFSMLGDGCDLSMAVVRDVFCQCGYDVEKYLDMYLLILWGMRYQVPNEVAGHLFNIDTHLHISNPCDVCFAVASVSMDNLVTLLSFCCKSRISARLVVFSASMSNLSGVSYYHDNGNLQVLSKLDYNF
ncbi:hypothetical protein C5167_047211 [Papaver somniferum]|uniref:Uncharacterized protein n=1 Tax=Papaver somniferum TaxID=3469 RepID=A0A4Y7LFZ6_PAPSO|nr:uncharacterized protein LOC113322646 isoform X1 [Papaver somniferum]RZC84423.1 hypothetical protein C5167_047211 [Papaver somniferum]